MRRVLVVLNVLVCIFSLCGFRPAPQASVANVAIINRSGQSTARITDGDMIRLQVKLSQTFSQQEKITFTLGDQGAVVGDCIISEGGDTCQTESFLSLGWHWDAGGTAQNTRVVNAYRSGNNYLGQSDALEVLPRPVVMVHGFISTWDSWKA